MSFDVMEEGTPCDYCGQPFGFMDDDWAVCPTCRAEYINMDFEGGENVKRLIVTALFTVHCDNLSVAQMKRMGLPFVGLLNKQNIDKAGIGNSDAYRIAGLHQIINQFQSNFGEGTELNAEFINVSAFGREDAILDGVGLSLDLIGASLK